MKKTKAVLSLLVLLFTLLLIPMPSYASDKISVYIDNEHIRFDTEPVIENNRTLVPMREIFELFGYDIRWNELTQTVTAIKEDSKLTIQVNQSTAYKDGTPVHLDTPAKVINGHVMIPLRFLTDTTEATVTWHSDKSSIVIYTKREITPSDSVVKLTSEHLQGSGVVLSDTGLIATNFHVIEKAESVTVVFNDETVYRGDVIVTGYDTNKDLAIIKIDPSKLDIPLYPVTLGDSKSVKIGDSVTAIGSPNGDLNKITTGVVTGFSSNTICTTTVIDHGSSGGALFNTKNELIGITSAFSSDKNYLSIPVNIMKEIGVNGQYPLSLIAKLELKPMPVRELNVTYVGQTAYLNWENLYGADYYYIYKSNYADSGFYPIKNPSTNTNAWYWGYPNCFGIKIEEGKTFYLKVASVRDGKVSALSEPIEIKLP